MSDALYVGIDAGSSATKCVVLSATGELLAQAVVPSGFDYGEAAERALEQALRDVATPSGRDPLAVPAAPSAPERPAHSPRPADLRRAIAGCISTGYGRERVPRAGRHITEITCHARGAREWYADVRGIVDIGGQDTKVIWLNTHGRMADYRMNAKCAAGTGTFLESTALKLGVSLAEIDALALTSTTRTLLNSYCTVFTGTEVIERIKAGEPRQDICMGLFRSIATRVFEMLGRRDGPIAATGGVVAHCRAMVRALEEVLGTNVLLPPLPQHAGAFGAALLALESDSPQSTEDSPQSTQRTQRKPEMVGERPLSAPPETPTPAARQTPSATDSQSFSAFSAFSAVNPACMPAKER